MARRKVLSELVGAHLHDAVAGSVEITATGETRTFGPGGVLLVEDTTGTRHSSRSATGFTAAVVVLDDIPQGHGHG